MKTISGECGKNSFENMLKTPFSKLISPSGLISSRGLYAIVLILCITFLRLCVDKDLPQVIFIIMFSIFPVTRGEAMGS